MKLVVKGSTISGRGVFAKDRIKKGELIHHMGGRRVSLAQCIAGVATGSIRMDDPLPVKKYEYLALDEFSILFNHSCQPNAGLANECDLTAMRDIAVGEEITFDYSMTVRRSIFTAFWKMPCGCQAPSCRKEVGDVRTIARQHLQRHVEAGALQDFILASLKIKPRRALSAAR